MVLLGLVSLTGALADSKVGGWLHDSGPTAVSASMTGIDRVVVRADSGLIRLEAVDRPDLNVTLNGGTPGSVKVDLARQGRELQVRLSSPWWHSPRFSETTAVEIRLPKTALASLAVDVETARVEVRQIRADKLTFKGQTGIFLAESVETLEADLRLITGKIELVHHAGAMQAHLTTGSLQAQFDVLSGPVRIDEVTGQVLLDLPDDAGFTLNASSGTGVVTSSLPLKDASDARRNMVRGTLGAGTHAVDLRVESGSITVR